MFELRDLYQEVIIDHGRHPRNFGKLEHATHVKEGFNPLCGDQIILYMIVENNEITKIKFEGTGCAISMASASLLSEMLLGKNLSAVDEIFKHFHQLVTRRDCPCEITEKMGKLAVFNGVSEFPARVKCATLVWHTLNAALKQIPGLITTEDNK